MFLPFCPLNGSDVQILDDLGQQLDKGSPSPTLWKEILKVNDLVLRNARQAVPACWCSMALSVMGSRCQGDLHSSKHHSLAHKLLVWSRHFFLLLCATNVPGILNRGADLLSRVNPLYGDWRLHPQIVGMTWRRVGQAAVSYRALWIKAVPPCYILYPSV